MTTRTRPQGKRPAGRPARPQERGWLWVAAAIVAAGALALAVWATRDDGNGDAAAPGELADDPGVAHVHGLGIDPADGTLYVATHNGTFRIPDEGDAERMGESFQDTMGFTVAGPGDFLGSGHPDMAGMREGQPGQLGLIESTDGGESWQPLSLSGEVDFHGLAYAHDRVYGWDSGTGRFMVSTDREDWETRSTLDLYGFAVDPADAEHVIGATPEGLAASSDGGRQWAGLSAPAVVALAWDEASGLWGIGPDGQVHRSTDGGTTWGATGTLPGPPQALLAAGDTLYAAAEGGDATGIYQSTDDGQTWSLRYRDGG